MNVQTEPAPGAAAPRRYQVWAGTAAPAVFLGSAADRAAALRLVKDDVAACPNTPADRIEGLTTWSRKWWVLPALGGVLDDVPREGTSLRASATDGHRLALAGAPIRGGRLAIPPRTLLSRKTVAAMRTILRGAERHERATLSFTEGEVSPPDSAFGAIDTCGTQLVFALEHGEFPDYSAVLPSSWSTRIDVRRRDLLEMLKRAAAVLPETAARAVVEAAAATEST